MKIAGLVKLTLIDYPGCVACTVFLSGCNFRCPFCHNGQLVYGGGDEISQDELFAFLKKRRGVLDGVCISGGEPLINDDITQLVKKVKNMGYLVKIDTNGSCSERLAELICQKYVDYVAMDIKNCQTRYDTACGVAVDKEKIKRSVDILKNSDVEHEFRTTLVKGLHGESDIIECAKWIGGGERYFLQGYKASGNVIAPSGLSEFSADELKRILAAAREFAPLTELREIDV